MRRCRYTCVCVQVFDGLKRGITVGPAGDKWDLKWVRVRVCVPMVVVPLRPLGCYSVHVRPYACVQADVSCSGDNCAVKVRVQTDARHVVCLLLDRRVPAPH